MIQGRFNLKRYISHPIYLNTSKYLNLKTLNDEDSDEIVVEEKTKLVRLKTFNIVLEFNKTSTFLKNLDSIYTTLETLCRTILIKLIIFVLKNIGLIFWDMRFYKYLEYNVRIMLKLSSNQ